MIWLIFPDNAGDLLHAKVKQLLKKYTAIYYILFLLKFYSHKNI